MANIGAGTGTSLTLTSPGTISAVGNITGRNFRTSGLITATGNVTGGNINTSGNVTGSYFIGNGRQLTGITAVTTYGNANVTNLLSSFGSNSISSTGTISSTNITATGNVSGAIVSASILSATGYVIVGSNPSSYISTAGNVVAAGNVAAGNVVATGYFVGNGSQLTGITTTYGNTNATSLMAAFGSNNISTTGTVTAGAVTGTTLSATGNITGGNMRSLGTITSTGNIVAPKFIGNGAGTPTLSSSTNLDLSAVAAVRVVGGGTFRMPLMTTAQRDGLVAINGDVIYNTTLNRFQGYQAGAWVNLA